MGETMHIDVDRTEWEQSLFDQLPEWLRNETWVARASLDKRAEAAGLPRPFIDKIEITIT